MTKAVQVIVRWLIAIVLVSIPVSYIFWQWRYSEHKELQGLSPEAFTTEIAEGAPPAYWPYAVYLMIVTAVVVTAVALIAGGLRVVFPPPKPKEATKPAPGPAPKHT